jgi:hypothetical protein
MALPVDQFKRPPPPERPFVNDHRIRLRGGWECQSAGPAQEGDRITLPVRWGASHPARLRLSRRFGRPPIDTTRQLLLLELDRARGIQSLLLNGKALTAISPQKSYYLIPLAEIEERNLLAIEVETGEAANDSTDAEQDWGHFALVIRSIDRSARD